MTVQVGDTVRVDRGLIYEVDAIDDDGKLTVTIVENGKRVDFCKYESCDPQLFEVVNSASNS